MIEGYRKDFNTFVTRCRGTPRQPGLVLGLEPDRNASAQGLLLRVEPARADAVWAAFHRRELADADYVPALVAVRRRDTGENMAAAAVLVDTSSPAYVRALDVDTTARILAPPAHAAATLTMRCSASPSTAPSMAKYPSIWRSSREDLHRY